MMMIVLDIFQISVKMVVGIHFCNLSGNSKVTVLIMQFITVIKTTNEIRSLKKPQLPEKRLVEFSMKHSFESISINRLSTFTTLLSWLSRQIYEAGADNKHLKGAKEVAIKSTRAAVRRLSIKCARESISSRASQTLQMSKKRKSGHVYPEIRYLYRLLSYHTQASLGYHQEDQTFVILYCCKIILGCVVTKSSITKKSPHVNT